MKKRAVILLVTTILFVVSFFIYREYQKLHGQKFSVTFFNIGQGDSALIKFRNGEKMLVDCGPDSLVLNKLSASLSFFDRSIDYLLVSHPDLDHYGGCPDVISRYYVKNIIINSEKKEYDNFWQAWNSAMYSSGAKIKLVTTTYNLSIAETIINFLATASSSPILKPDSNNNSLVFKLTDPKSDTSVLFTGDIEADAERAYRLTYCTVSSTLCPYLHVKYLKAAHHGSDSSSSEDWLDAIRPDVAIVSVGKNKFGHPSLRVLRHLSRVGAEIWRTDEKNDIIVGEN